MGSQYGSGDQKGNSTVDFSALRTLTDIGIDTKFLGEFGKIIMIVGCKIISQDFAWGLFLCISLTDINIMVQSPYFDYSKYVFTEELEKRETVINTQLEENANLLDSLAKEQKERLSRPVPASLTTLPNPTSKEINLGKDYFFLLNLYLELFFIFVVTF